MDNLSKVLHVCTMLLVFAYLVGWNEWPLVILLLPSLIVLAQRIIVEVFWTALAILVAYLLAYGFWYLQSPSIHSGVLA